MKKHHYAVLIAQGLSYGLIITFLFADARYNLSGFLRGEDLAITFQTAHIAACLIGFVGIVSIWLTWQYMFKASSMRDMLVICAWTHRVKTDEGWIPLEKFITDQLGYAISHGMSDSTFQELRKEVDQNWKNVKPKVPHQDADKPPIGLTPKQTPIEHAALKNPASINT